MLDLSMIWSVAKKGHAQNEIAKDMMLQSKVLSQLVPCPQWKHSFYTRSMHCTFLPWIPILGSFARCSKHAKSVDSMRSQHGGSVQLACCTMQQYISLIQDLSVTGRCIPSPLWGKVKWLGGSGSKKYIQGLYISMHCTYSNYHDSFTKQTRQLYMRSLSSCLWFSAVWE